MGKNISSFNQAGLEQITEAAQKAGIHKWILEPPNQYNTYLTKQFDEYGANFSGDELQ